MNPLVPQIVHDGFALAQRSVATYWREDGRLPHMMWAFTTDPLLTPDVSYRYSMIEIPRMPIVIAQQQRLIDDSGEDMAARGWRYRGSELQVSMFVGPFWPDAEPGEVHHPEFPTVIFQTWASGVGPSTILYPVIWTGGTIDHLEQPALVEFVGEHYATRFAQVFQGLAAARRN